VRPNTEARSQVRPDTRAASGSTGAGAGGAGTGGGRSTRSLRGSPTRRDRSCDGRAGARSRAHLRRFMILPGSVAHDSLAAQKRPFGTQLRQSN
jgi:hypothetical protein